MPLELVERAQRGDEQAFAAIVRIAGGQLFAIAYRILRDSGAAEDAVQAAFVDAWRGLPGLRDPARFDAWLTRLLVHACGAVARRERRRRILDVRLLTTDEEVADDHAGQVIDREQIDRGFRRLSADHRAVLVLHHYQGLPLAAVADVLGVPVGTVKSRLHYATNALRAALEADDRRGIPAETMP